MIRTARGGAAARRWVCAVVVALGVALALLLHHEVAALPVAVAPPPGHAISGHAMSGHATSGHVMPGPPMPGAPASEHPMSGAPMPGHAMSGAPASEHSMPGPTTSPHPAMTMRAAPERTLLPTPVPPAVGPAANSAGGGACTTPGTPHCSTASADAPTLAPPPPGQAEPAPYRHRAVAGRKAARTIGRAPPDLSVLSQLRI